MSYGVTATGFVRKHYADIKTDIEDAFKTAFGANIDLAVDSPFGKVVAIFAQREADLWELAEAVYNTFSPDNAAGVSLDNGAALVGIVRQPATRSTVIEELVGSVGITIPINSKIKTTTASDEFQTAAACTLSALVCSSAYVDLNGAAASGLYRITINGTNFDYTATVPSDDETVILDTNLKATINAGAEPVTADYVDGQLVIVGDDDADGQPTPFSLTVSANLSILEVGNLQAMEAVNTGPVIGYAGTLTDIVSALSGWTSATNHVDATLGADEELDSALRDRRADSLANPGAATVDAIYAAVAAVASVTEVVVVHNPTDSVDSDGNLPHSIHAVVAGGTDQAIADALWDVVCGGIYTNGTEVEVVTDSQGVEQTVRFSRFTELDFYVQVTYALYSEEDFPSNGEALIAAAVLAAGQAHKGNEDVLPDRFYGPIFAACGGIQTLTVEVKTTGSYQTTPFAVAFDEIAKFASGRITVTT